MNRFTVVVNECSSVFCPQFQVLQVGEMPRDEIRQFCARLVTVNSIDFNAARIMPSDGAELIG